MASPSICKFKFRLNQKIRISDSGETGTVIGRADFTDRKKEYEIRYKANNGCHTQRWMSEAALEAA
jgi:hypothetical protein